MNSIQVCLLMVIGLSTCIEGIPFRSGYHLKEQRKPWDSYLKVLSKNYLQLIKSLLTKKHHQHAATKRSDEEHISNDIDDLLSNINKKREYTNKNSNAILNSYIRRISSNYLQMIKDFLSSRHPNKVLTK